MAGTVDLSNFLTSAELTALPDPVKSKIESHVQTLNKENEELKSIYERLRVNTEQQHFEIEKQLIASNTKLEADSAANTQLREQVAELEKKYNEATEKLKDIKTSDEGNLSTKLHLSKINEQLECEKREFAVLLEKRNREIDNKNDEVKELSQKLSEAITAKCEAMAKLDEVSSNQMNRELVIKRLEQELENLKSQMEWQDKDLKEKTKELMNVRRDKLENLKSQMEWQDKDLKEKTKELMNVRRDKSSKLLEVQAKLEEKTEECSLQQATIESLRKTNSAQTTKIDQLIQRVKDVQDSNSQSEEQFRQEIQARIRLVDLYKNSAQEAENKATELTGAVTELQKLLQAAATAHTELENEKDDEVQQWKDEVEKRDRKIGSLEQELVNANDLLSAMKQRGLSEEKLDVMFPTAAATSKLLKSGMSLTQIYNEYVQATDSLQLEKEENKRLNTYLDQILQEIEQKAPLLKKQREDYDIALKSIDQMTRQLDAAMVDCQNLQAETDESNRKSGHLTKENQRQQQQIKDLSDQVRYLVKEVEELQGGRVVRDEVSSTEVSSSSRIISDKLVTFRNIEEMQEQNQKLLSVIRELSDKQEQEENSAVDSKTRALSEQLEMAHEELSVLKDARTRQAEMVESIVRQRDMYRVLLQQANITPMPLMPGSSPVKDTRSPGPQRNPEQDKKLEETGQALKQLQAEINSYKKDKIDNEKMLYDQIDKDRKEMSDLRLQNAKLASQLDFAAERYKVLQGNAEGYRKEISILRDKIQKYNTSTAKYEQSVNSLKQELLSTQEQLSQVQAREENLRREKDIIRSTEMRLTAEMESMRRERNSQSMLMANLQAIQNNLERTDRENKRTLSNQIEALEREKTYLRKRLETEERQHGTVMKHLEHQAQEHRKSLDLEMKAHQETRNRLSTTAQQLQENKQLLESTTAQLQAAEARLQNLTVQESGIEQTNEEIRDLKSQLLEKKTEVESLHAQLEKTRGHAEQYKTIADTLQHTIKQQNQASEEFKESLEEKLREADEKVVHLDQRVDGLEKERQELLNENLRITEERHSLNGDLRNQLSSLQNELQEAVERRETAVAVEMSAKQECEHQTRLAAEAQDKYERELMLHAASVDALGAVKKQLESYNTNLSEWEEKAKIAEKTLEVSKTSWDQREKLLIAEKDRLASRVEDLIGQTRALHDQMSKLSNQVITVQERAVASTQNRAAMGGKPQDDSTKSSEQLLEVIKFLRKEKDIAEGRLDVVETECSRMKQRCEALERQVEAANTDLAEERRNAQAEIQTASQHADLMMKVESYNLLHDSNKLLREEKEHLQATVTATEAKLSKLEEQIRPLQEEIRELTAQRDSLTLDKRSALAEVDRWRARTTQLIEQSHKTDPEEHRRLIQEKEELRKQLTSLTEELHKAKAEATKQSVENAKLQRQLTMATEKQTKLTAELKETKEQLEEQSKDSLEKSKMVQQLKKIGRKYKEQAEIMTKEFDDYKASHVDDDARIKQAQLLQQANEQKLQEATAKLEASEAVLKEMAAKHEETIEKAAAEANAVKSKLEASLMEATLKKTSIEQQVTSLTAEKKQLEAKVQNLEAALKGHSTEQQEIAKLKEELAKQTKLEAKLKEDLAKQPKLEAKLKEEFGKQTKLEAAKLTKLQEEMLKVSQELSKVQQELHKVQEEKGEQEKSNTKMKSMLVAAKTKLQSMKDINEKLTAERLEMKKRLSSSEQASSEEAEAQVASLKTMYDNQIQKLEKDLATKTEEIVELQAKLQQLQSSQKLGPGQSQVQPSRSTGTVAAERISSSTSELPKTANIRPIASSPVAIKPQTVPVQPQSAASKATASIRPMAIAPTTVSPMPSTMGTPTATVMPTTVTQQEQQMEGDAVSPVQQLFPQPSTSGTARPTQQVQRVIPTQESSSMEPETSGSSGTETGIVEPQPSSSRETPVAPIAAPAGPHSNKRQRDDLESPGEDTTVKRTKVTTVEESPTIPEIHVTDESAAPVTQVVTAQEPEGELDLEVPEADDEPADEQTIEEVEADDEGTADIVEEDIQVQDEAERQEVQQEDDDSGDVIIVASDEEEGEEEEEDEEEENEEEEEEEEGDEDDYAEEDLDNIEYIDENPEDEMDEEHGFDQDEGLQAGDRGTSEDDDVVIIELGEDDDGAMSSQEPTSQPSSQPSSQTSHTLLPPLQQPLAPERQLSVPRNQLTPFMLGSTAGFEDMDDCTVPSTPTLNVPRRGDGFAEAVSSPQVSQRFIFGSGGSEHNLTLSGLAQLDSQAGMGMDDTRMDLSQLEEGSGRSVPSTPLHTSAPVTVISDITDPGAADTAVSSSQGEGGEGQDETDQGQLGEEEGLEGDGEIDEDIEAELGDEDFQPEYQEHEDGSQDIPGGDGGGEASTSQGDGSGSGMGDKDAGRPKIQKIVWDAPAPTPQATGSPIQTIVGTQGIPSLAQPVQQYRPARGVLRGVPQSRGSRGTFTRGQTRRPMRGGRGGGGMYTRRPPMY